MNCYYKTIKRTTGSALLALSVQFPAMADVEIAADQYIYQEVVAYLPANKAKTSAVAQAHIQFELHVAHTTACKSACKQGWAQQGTLLKQEGPYLDSIIKNDQSRSVWVYKTTRKLDRTSCVSGPVYENTMQTTLPEWLSIQTHNDNAEGVATLEELPLN